MIKKLSLISGLIFLNLFVKAYTEEIKPAGILLGGPASNYQYEMFSEFDAFVDAPRPINDFETYTITIFDEKISGITLMSRDFEDMTGSGCKNRFTELKTSLVSRYGSPDANKEFTDSYYLENPSRFNYGLKIGLNEFYVAFFKEEVNVLLSISAQDHYSCSLTLGYQHPGLTAQKHNKEKNYEQDNL